MTSIRASSSIVVRLWIQPLVCQAMVVLLALITLTIMGFQIKHKKRLTRRINPGSIAATAFLAGQAATSSFPTGLGAASGKHLHAALDDLLAKHDSLSPPHLQPPPAMEEDSLSRTVASTFPGSCDKPTFQKPLPLRPVSHIALILTIAACGITLVFSLGKSSDKQGLGNAASSEHLLFAWSMVPAAILTAISWWLSSVDTQLRLLAPYHLLKRNKCSHSVLHLDLLRGVVPCVLYQELKTSNFATASTTLSALLGSILTTVSATMFHAFTFPVSRSVELSPKTFFVNLTATPYSINDTSLVETGRLASLILETNLSFPYGTYQDLVFPELSMTPFGANKSVSDTTNATSASIKVTAPALRPRLTCRVYSPTEIPATYVHNQSVYSGRQGNGIVVNISSNYASNCHEAAFFDTGNLSESLFARATTSSEYEETERRAGSCSDMLYIWGYHDTSVGPVTNISAGVCNGSVELVDVTYSLLEPDLIRLDLLDAPAPIESTARNIYWNWTLGVFIYEGLASLPTTNHSLFDTFFQQLVTSRYAIPISAIGDPTQADMVMDAIRFQHAIVKAQFLNSDYRIDVNSSTAMGNTSAVLNPTLFNQSTSDGATRYLATLTYPFGSHRVVQDPIATAVLGALLLSILILVTLGWYLSPREPALPRSPSSIGSVLALLAGGNVLERLYDEGSEPLCWDDVKSRLGKDSKLYLGWNTVNGGGGEEQRRFGIWITDQRKWRKKIDFLKTSRIYEPALEEGKKTADSSIHSA